MAKHQKFSDSLDVQVRTRILDQYGNPIQGAIEYDPSTGFGKRIKDPTLGLVEDFFLKDGSVEIDGQNFDDTNHDQSKIDAIKDMVALKVSRNTPEYDDLLKQHINQKRDEDKAKHPGGPHKEPDTPLNLASLKFTAATQIAKGEKVDVDPDTLLVTGTRSKNVFKPDPKNQANDLQWINPPNRNKRTKNK